VGAVWQIAEMAMLPVKDTRTILYKLLKGNYVTLQEVSKTGDHNPQRTFYVWRVDMSKVSSPTPVPTLI
jgi:DNA-directed RNA polymerase III subunit RPC3